MARSNTGTQLLLWIMFLLGGGSLFAGLILPPWLEYRALQQAHAAARRRIAQLEAYSRRLAKQIEHLQNDPAYVERLNRKEFGIETPGVEMIWIDTPEDALTQSLSVPAATTADGDEKLAETIAQAAHTNALVAVFVLAETRRIVMAMSAVVMLVALVLLSRSGSPQRRREERP